MNNTPNITADQTHLEFLAALQKKLRTQDEAFTRSPLYCVYDRASEDDDANGEGWPEAIFLTAETAENYMRNFKHRFAFPYIYVRSPGERSELHTLLTLLKEIEVGNGPFVEPEE